MGLGWWHILLVLVVFVLLFGAGRVSSLMGDIAKGFKSFDKAMAEADDDASPKGEIVNNKGPKARRSRIAPATKAVRT